MKIHRREILKLAGGAGVISALLSAGLIRPETVHASEWNETAFSQKTLADALKALGASEAGESASVSILGLDIAENSAAVPVTLVSRLENTQSIALLIEKNPNVLAALYRFPLGGPAEVQCRVKMAQTSNVYALVEAGGAFHFARKEIKVTLGGCGG